MKVYTPTIYTLYLSKPENSNPFILTNNTLDTSEETLLDESLQSDDTSLKEDLSGENIPGIYRQLLRLEISNSDLSDLDLMNLAKEVTGTTFTPILGTSAANNLKELGRKYLSTFLRLGVIPEYYQRRNNKLNLIPRSK